MRKLLAVLLTLVMALSLTVTAFADDTTDTHTYTAYKIFAGTQTADENDATLGAVEWGDGIDSTNFLIALQASEDFGDPNAFKDCDTADKVAAAMAEWKDSSLMAKAFAKLAEDYVVVAKGITAVNEKTELDAGYYLVVDTTSSVAATDAYNIALLQLTKKSKFEIAFKNSVPEVKKTVNNGLTCTKLDENAEDYDEKHVHTKECYDWEKSNNAALGDTVNFKIDSAVPATATEYEYYFFIINDTLSDGLDFAEPMNLKVYIDGKEATATTDYTVKISGRNLQIALVDAIANAGKSVVVTYDAVLNTAAIIGVKGNSNKVTVDFSNNPNEDFQGRPDDENNPGFPADEDYTPGGKTPEDYTLTFTSKINVYKVDEKSNPLQGAEFTLYGDTLNKVLVMKEQFAKDAAGTFYKLNSGSYTEEKPITADYMKEAEEGATEGYVVAETGFEGETVTVGEKTYRAYVPSKDTENGVKIYVLVKANANLYVSTSDMYKCEWVSETQTIGGEKVSVVGTVDENGIVSFAGLPAGSYTLSETVVPNGYNPIDDIEFAIDWTAPATVTTGAEMCTWTKVSGADYNADKDAFEITVVNQKGTTLPETGGIGTTIFYVVGSILLVGAVVLLVTKKRMSTEA